MSLDKGSVSPGCDLGSPPTHNEDFAQSMGRQQRFFKLSMFAFFVVAVILDILIWFRP